MQSVRSIPVRVMCAYGAGLVVLGWGLHALTTPFLPGADAMSLRTGVMLVVLLAGAGAIALRRSRRSSAQDREQQLNHSLLASAAHGIISTDAHGLVEGFSKGAERLLGYRAADVVGRVTYTTFHLDAELKARADELRVSLRRSIPDGFAALVVQATATAETEEREWTYIRKDGTRVPVRVSLTAMRNRHGNITGYLALASDLSQQRLAEERRQELDSRLGQIASQVPGMVFQYKQFPDGRHCFPYASEGIRQIYGLEPAAVVENSSAIWELIHPEDVERVAMSIAESGAMLTRWECEYRARLPDGTERWVSGTAMPERQSDGAVVWQGFITDVSERKRAERMHEESRVLLQSVFSTVDLGVFVVDVTNAGEFRFIEINPAYERMTGISAANCRGRSPRDLVPLIPAEMAECLRSSFRRGIESPGPIEYEEPFLLNERSVWWLTRLTPLRDSVGNVVRLVGRSLDITERKTIELRFQSLTERLQLATEAAQVGIWDYDLTQQRIVWDKRMHALYGLAAFDGNYATWRARLHPNDLERMEQEIRDANENRKPFNTSFRILRLDGEEREIRACAHVQLDESGRAIRMVGVNWDVTAERRGQSEIVRARDQAQRLNHQLEEALARANRLAQEAGAATVAKSEFLANMSHEIRTPLNAVIGMSGLLLGGELSKEQREFAETIRSSGDALLGLLNDILDYSKIESGRLDLEQRPFDVRDCAESALDVLAGRAAEKGLDLLCLIDPGVPNAILGDDTRLRQVLVNLLSNSVKFTASGEVSLEISVVNRKDENVRLRFSVHDSGIGIPADRMDRLFKSFSQVDASTTRQYGGSGLGLAICKRIIELMQGRIWVETTNASGSIFCFEVSMAVGPANTAGNSKRAALLAGRRILIVDDSAMSRRALGQHCDAWRMSAHAVASGEAALAQVDQGTAFDLALIDIDMPGMSGTELVAALRRKRSAFQLPIAMLTRRGRPPDADELEIAAFVSKPVKAAALFDLLAEILDGRRATRSSGKAEGAALGVDHPLAILLAEDNPVNQRVAILMLQRLGYRADVAANGREALEAVERQRYDLVLMDVQMPEMDGLQAAREIRSRLQQRRPRIVAMTANASTSDREECFAAGMDDFLPKPVCGADLRKAILETPARYVASAA